MRLYRHHTQQHQEAIKAANGAFVTDMSRKYNNTGRDKNAAGLYFYSMSAAGAEMYQKEDTILFAYESDASLLDLRDAAARTSLMQVAVMFAEQDNKIKKDTLAIPSMKSVLKANKAMRAELEKETTIDDVIADRPYSGRTFWGQGVTDFEMGTLVKEYLINSDYDGIIFRDGNSIEVALLEPAKEVSL